MIVKLIYDNIIFDIIFILTW